jgi:hypothetical protein
LTPYRANKSDHTKRDCYDPQDIDEDVANIARVGGTALDTEDATRSDEQGSDEDHPGPGEVVDQLALLFAGFWDKRLSILGAAGSVVTFVMTITIIPFMPNGWAASAGGFPAMTGNIPFLMKDVVLLAASIYLLKQDVERIGQR